MNFCMFLLFSGGVIGWSAGRVWVLLVQKSKLLLSCLSPTVSKAGRSVISGPERFRPTDVRVDRRFLHFLSPDFSSRRRVSVYRISCINCVAVALFFYFTSAWFADIAELVWTVFCLDLVTSSSTGKFRKAVSKVFFSTPRKCCIFLVLSLFFVLFFFQDSQKCIIEPFVLPGCELTHMYKFVFF